MLEVDSTSDGIARIRTAYRETVLAVEHYEQEYGEPLLENVTLEFGSGVAHTLPELQSDSDEAVQADAGLFCGTCITQRTEVLTALETERESLVAARDELTALVDSIESTCIPSWYRPEFRDSCETLATKRQATLKKSGSTVGQSSYGLYEYLYQSEPWTYPVLTAVARLCRSVVT